MAPRELAGVLPVGPEPHQHAGEMITPNRRRLYQKVGRFTSSSDNGFSTLGGLNSRLFQWAGVGDEMSTFWDANMELHIKQYLHHYFLRYFHDCEGFRRDLITDGYWTFNF
jgi:hypothetical protein